MANKKAFLLIIISLCLPAAALAINFIDAPTGGIDYSGSLIDFIQKIFQFVIWPIVVTVIVVLFIMAGISFLTSAGEPSKIETARRYVIWGVIGVVVILISFSILITIQSILNIT